MKWSFEWILVAFLLATMSIACGSSSTNEIVLPASSSPGPAQINTSTQGAQAASAVSQARDFVLTNTELFKNLGEFGLSVMASDPSLAGANTDIPCSDGGTYKYAGSATSGTYSLTLTFAGCRDNGFQYEGSYSLTGTSSDIYVSLGNSSTTFNTFYFNSDYTVLIEYLKADSSFHMTGSRTATDGSYTISPSGSITTFDYFLLDTFTMSFIRYSTDYTLSTDPATGDQTATITANGYFSESWTAHSLFATLSDFMVQKVELYDPAMPGFYAVDTSISGSITFAFRPTDFGIGGQLNIVTQVPIRNDYSAGYTTQGTIVINSAAAVQYNSGGDIDVTVTGDAPLNYAREYSLMKISDFSAMEETIPPLLGPSGNTTGDKMTITLTWFGGSSSDMDLHLKYYNVTNPTPSTAETWHMDWHQGKTYPGTTGNCTDPAGITFGDAFDLDAGGNGVCDVGLDFDDTQGYGPEHITATKVPAGYYVVSVNSYSLDSDPFATMYLAVHIGDYIFGPYTTTLTSSDGESTDIASWFRVADVRVNEDGTVDVLAPDLSLTPWH